jgi:hypothetical protein
MQPRVTRAINLAHTSGPERLEDFVGSETRAGANEHRSGVGL